MSTYENKNAENRNDLNPHNTPYTPRRAGQAAGRGRAGRAILAAVGLALAFVVGCSSPQQTEQVHDTNNAVRDTTDTLRDMWDFGTEIAEYFRR